MLLICYLDAAYMLPRCSQNAVPNLQPMCTLGFADTFQGNSKLVFNIAV